MKTYVFLNNETGKSLKVEADALLDAKLIAIDKKFEFHDITIDGKDKKELLELHVDMALGLAAELYGPIDHSEITRNLYDVLNEIWEVEI